jgi:uncharacterized protein (DUF433 family)
MAKRIINAREVVAELRSGMDDAALMQKYELSAEWLRILFKKLVDGGLLGQDELDQRSTVPGRSRQTSSADLADLEDTDDFSEFQKTIDLGAALERPTGIKPDSGKPVSDKRRRPAEGAEKLGAESVQLKRFSVQLTDILQDIRSGIDQQGLMRKYNLPEKALSAVLAELVKTGAVGRAEVDRRLALAAPSLLIESALFEEASRTIDLSDIAMKMPRATDEIADAAQPPARPSPDAFPAPITPDTAQALHEFAVWWRTAGPGAAARLRSAPRFRDAGGAARQVRLCDDLVRAAEAKAGKDVESLLNILLWQFLDCDPRFVE